MKNIMDKKSGIIFLTGLLLFFSTPFSGAAENNSGKLAAFFANKIRVVGEVNSPTLMKFQEGMTVWDAITKAGGISPVADIQEIKIRRQEGDKLKLIPVFQGIEFNKKIPLKGGDLILIPEHKLKAQRAFSDLLDKYPAARQKIMQLKNKGFSEQWIRKFIYQITNGQTAHPEQSPR
ncbi:MAG: polysaccharide biosynthesis/export family protein [bacterium]